MVSVLRRKGGIRGALAVEREREGRLRADTVDPPSKREWLPGMVPRGVWRQASFLFSDGGGGCFRDSKVDSDSFGWREDAMIATRPH